VQLDTPVNRVGRVRLEILVRKDNEDLTDFKDRRVIVDLPDLPAVLDRKGRSVRLGRSVHRVAVAAKDGPDSQVIQLIHCFGCCCCCY